MQQFQNIVLFCLRWFQQKSFVNDYQNWISVLGLNLFIGSIGACYVEFKGHIRQANILRLVTLLAGFHADCTCHVVFSASGGTGDEQVLMLRDVLAGGKAFDPAPVEFPAGSIVDVTDIRLGLVI